MKHLFYSDIRRPLAPGAGIVLGAAGRRGARCPGHPDLCDAVPDSLPFAGNCPCGSVRRPL